jgi:hypothetical protein
VLGRELRARGGRVLQPVTRGPARRRWTSAQDPGRRRREPGHPGHGPFVAAVARVPVCSSNAIAPVGSHPPATGGRAARRGGDLDQLGGERQRQAVGHEERELCCNSGKALALADRIARACVRTEVCSHTEPRSMLCAIPTSRRTSTRRMAALGQLMPAQATMFLGTWDHHGSL